MITIPPNLKKGDTIGITCPAGYMEMKKVKTCITVLQQWGYKVIVGKTVGSNSANYFSGTDAERADELQAMLNDKNIHAILCGRGGYGLSRIIDQLDFKPLKKNPKWIIGFSDITVLLAHLYTKYKIASLHAPMANAFNNGGADNNYVQSLRKALKGAKTQYSCATHPLNRSGKAEGALVGGNLSLVAHLVGTESGYKTDGKILFLEDIGEYIYSIDRMMMQLKRAGILDNLAALIIGGFTDVKDTERPFGESIESLIAGHTAEYDYPVCFKFPVSHAQDNYALKVGLKYQLKITAGKTVLKEV